jgi:hypothetical protein
VNSSAQVRVDATRLLAAVGFRPGPTRLCCALIDLAQALAVRVPQIGTKLVPNGTLCNCSTSRTGGSVWCSDDGAL